MSAECRKSNKSLHQTFDPLPIFATVKTGIASNAGELKRYVHSMRIVVVLLLMLSIRIFAIGDEPWASYRDEFLSEFDEPLLLDLDRKRVYRFYWQSAFIGGAVVRVEYESKVVATVTAKKWVTDGDKGNSLPDNVITVVDKKPLEPLVAAKLLSKIRIECKVWSMNKWESYNQPSEAGFYDGPIWFFEAKEGTRYNIFSYNEPDNGCFYELGNMFLEIGGIEYTPYP